MLLVLMIVLILITPLILSVMNQRETILWNATAEVSDFMHFSLFILFSLSVPPCHLQPYLNYIDYYGFYNGYTDTYQVGLCFNYTFGDLCTAGITNEVATLICRNRGYSKWWYASAYNSLPLASGAVNTSYYANSTYSRFGVNYAEFGCPSNASSLSSCYDNFTTVNNCSMGYGGYLVLSCTYCTFANIEFLNNYNFSLLAFGGVSSSSVASPTPSPTISATIDSTGVFTSSVSTIIDSTGVFTSSVSITPTPTSTPGISYCIFIIINLSYQLLVTCSLECYTLPSSIPVIVLQVYFKLLFALTPLTATCVLMESLMILLLWYVEIMTLVSAWKWYYSCLENILHFHHATCTLSSSLSLISFWQGDYRLC